MRKVLTLMVLLLAGCSSSHPAEVKPSASALSKAEANRQFAQCMREHGVDVPDPGPDGSLQFDAGAAVDRNQAVAAASQCQRFLPNGGELTNLSPEQLEQGRAFAKCMREHGIDMPDPDPESGLSAILKGGIDFNSPEFKAATEACKGVVQR
jgi:hypothetical protein